MATLPAFIVEIDADPSTTGLFVLGTSVLGGTNTLAADERYIAVPAGDVQQILIRRGRSREDEVNRPGECTVVLDGFSGNYDPDNPATTYSRFGVVQLRLGMKCRIKVTVAGTDYQLFAGDLSNVQVDHGRDPRVTWTFTDVLSKLAQYDFAPLEQYAREGEQTGNRAAWVLDAARIPATARTITAGGRTLLATAGGGTVLSQLETLARSERGRVYADRLGSIVVSQHADEYGKTTVLTVTDSGAANGVEYDGIDIEPGLKHVVNDATVTRTRWTGAYDSSGKGVTVVDTYLAGDIASQNDRGVRSIATDVVLQQPGDMQALATYLSTFRKDAASRVINVDCTVAGLPDATLALVGVLDLGSQVVVQRTTYDGRALVYTVTVEGINHTISTGGWRMNLATAPVDNLYAGAAQFVLGTSTLGGTAVLALY